jgi:hypothetical protein
MATRHAFVLNLDADLELASLGPYTPSRNIEKAMTKHALALAQTLVPEGDVLVVPTTPGRSLDGITGLAFSPTPSACSRLAQVGARVRNAVPVGVLRVVSRRDFAYVSELPQSRVHTSAESVLAHIAKASPLGDGYRLKRAFGMAGRGHRIIRGKPSASDDAFVRASSALIVEPNVRILRELSLHGYLRADASVVHGDICHATYDTRGAFVATSVLVKEDVPHEQAAALHAALERAGAALHAARYIGPFGVDAYAYEDGKRIAFRAQSEINARYSMGWGVGFRSHGRARPDLDPLDG